MRERKMIALHTSAIMLNSNGYIVVVWKYISNDTKDTIAFIFVDGYHMRPVVRAKITG